jgi:CheY-like chemotaxis protein
MDLSELCSTYMSEQQGRVKISRAKKLCKGKSAADVVNLQSGELLLIEFDDNPRPDAHGNGDKKRDTLTEDVTFPVKVVLQLFKQNRGKFLLPNPKFVAGGDEAEIIQINHMYSARNVTWRLKGGQVQVLPPSRQPIFMMSDFSSETRIATAFSLMGTEHPNKVNAEGVTLLPSGTFSSFLVLVFTTRDSRVRFLGTQSQEGVLTLEAALCDNVVLEIANRFDLTQINFCRRILSNAIAGHLVSTKDRRNIKQILADIVMKSKSMSTQSDSLLAQEGSVEWVVCLTEEASDYLPPFHLEHTYCREKPQNVINCHDMLERKKLHHVIEKILMPLLNARRMALNELNEIVMSNASVPRSEVGVLVSYFDAHHNAFIFKSQVSSDSTYEQVVVSTPQFEAKQEQNEELLSNLYAYRAGAPAGMLIGAPAATMRFGRKLEEEVRLQVSKASSDHLLETCKGDVQADEIQKQNYERNDQVAEAAALKDRTEDDEDENRRLLLILLGNEGSEVGSAGGGFAMDKALALSPVVESVAPANVAPDLSLSEQDCKFPAEVSSAVQVQGEANCVCMDTTISFTDRLRALETSLIALLRQHRQLTIQSLNQKVLEKISLRSICQQLFLDFQEKIEGSQSKVMIQTHTHILR